MSRPILSSQFFKKHGPKREFFRRFESHYTWNQQVMPVYEWEGLLYIASDSSDLLEASPEEWPSHWIVVEANTQDLENLWEEFQDQSEASQVSIHSATATSAVTATGVSNPEIPSIPEIPELSDISELPEIPELEISLNEDESLSALPILPDVPSEMEYGDSDEASLKDAVSIMKPPTQKKSDIPDIPNIPNLDELMNPEPAPKKSSAPAIDDLEAMMNAAEQTSSGTPTEEGSEEKLDMLEGLSMDSAPIKLSRVEDAIVIAPVEDVTEALPPVPTAAEVAPLPAMPAAKAKPPIPKSNISLLKKVEESVISEDTQPPVPLANFKKPEIPGVPVGVQREVDELTPTPPPAIPIPKSKVSLPLSAIKGSEIISPVEDASDETSFEETLPETPLVSELEPMVESAPVAKIPDPAVATMDIPHEERLLLDQLPRFYQRSFLALKAGNSIRLVSWPREATGEIAAKEKDFSLNTPSPFRIVMRTEKPYHGYLIQTTFMTQVFSAWNGGQYPETLTVIPVRADQTLVGFVICCGNKEAEKKVGLQAAEKVAESIGLKWKKIGAQFNAKAA